MLLPHYRAHGWLARAVGLRDRRNTARAIPMLCLLASTMAVCRVGHAQRKPALGLIVARDGTLTKGGSPFRGIGVNYFSAFSRTLQDPHDTSYEAGFAALEENGIPFCRIMAGGFWPNDQRLYLTDRPEFFRRLDAVVRSAETHRIGLILSCFWNLATVPDLCGEPVCAWGTANSRTRAHMRQYVRDLVARYRNSPAVWGWEFGNEYNLAADLPNAAEHRPPVAPSLGTPAMRSAKDEITYSMLRAAFGAFAREVRCLDPARMVETGDSIPRAAAWHNWKHGTWDADTADQTAELLDQTNPAPIDVVSVHFYKEPSGHLRRVAGYAKRSKRPLFIGEFGAEGIGAEAEAEFRKVLQSVIDSGAPLAALWVFDYDSQRDTWSVTDANARAYQLKAIAEANRSVNRHR